MEKEASSHSKSQLNAWTDQECQLLLNIALEHKNRYGKQAMNWQSTQHNFSNMNMQFMDKMVTSQPMNAKDASGSGSNPLNREELFQKLQAASRNCQHPIDGFDPNTNNVSGNIAPFYLDLCSHLWGTGLPDAHTTNGIKSRTNVSADAGFEFPQETENREGKKQCIGTMPYDAKEKGRGKHRKEYFDSRYQKCKDTKSKEKLKRKMHPTNHVHSIREGEGSIKRQILDGLEESDRRHQFHMQSMIQQIQMQSQLINEGFLLMRSMLIPDTTDSSFEFDSQVENTFNFTSYIQQIQYGHHNMMCADQNLPENYSQFYSY